MGGEGCGADPAASPCRSSGVVCRAAPVALSCTDLDWRVGGNSRLRRVRLLDSSASSREAT
eukprot:13155226-Alexandrium_andersonii.AAC.1